MKDFFQWRDEIEKTISSLKENGIKAYYGISLDMTMSTATGIKAHFSENYENVEVKRCNQCTNKFDIIITWL